MSNNWLDASSTSNRYRQMYIKGFLDISGGNLILRNNNFYVKQGDISLNGRLFVTKDASINGNLFVNNDVSINGVLTANYAANSIPTTAIVGGIPGTTGIFATDITAESRLFVTKDASLNSNLFVSGNTVVNGDVSLNNRLFVSGNAAFNNVTFAGTTSFNTLNAGTLYEGNVSLSSKYSTASYVITQVSGVVGTAPAKLSTLQSLATAINNDPSFSFTVAGRYAPLTAPYFITSITTPKLFTSSDSSLNGKLYVAGDTSMNNSLSVNRNIYEGGVLLSKKYASLTSPAFTGTLTVGQNIFVTGDVSANGLYINNGLNVSNGTVTLPASSIADSALSANIVNLNGSQTLTNKTITTSGIFTANADVSMNSRLSLSGDASFGGKLMVSGDASLNGDVSVKTQESTDNSSKVATTAFVKSVVGTTVDGYFQNDVSVNNRLFVNSDVSLNGNVYIQDNLMINGMLSVKQYSSKVVVTTISYEFIVAEDMSLNGRLFMTGDASINGNVLSNGKLVVNDGITVNGGVITLPQSSISDSALSSNIVTLGDNQTLTNKTLTAPKISSMVNGSATISLPATTDTLSTLSGTETLTNKTLTTSGLLTANAGLIVTNDTSMNGRFYVSGNTILDSDVSMNKNLDLNGSLIAHTNINVFGIINQNTVALDPGHVSNYSQAISGLTINSGENGANTLLGINAGDEIVTGTFNTCLGYNAGTTLTTGNNNILIGNDANASTSSTSNEITIGNSSITTLRCQAGTITQLSDERDKKNITTIPVGLEFINAIKPVKFNWNMRDGGKVDVEDFGFIAQDLQRVQYDLNTVVPNLVNTNNPDKLEASYASLIPIIVKSIQELKQIITEQQIEIERLTKFLNA